MTGFARGVLLVAAGVLVWLALDLLLLLFAGVLLAIFLRTLATWLAGRTRLGVGWSLAIVVLTLVGAVTLAASLYAPRLAEQSDQLAQTIPEAFSDLTSWLQQYTWGRWLLNQVSSPAAQGDVIGQATTVANRVVHAGVAIVVVLFTGLYLAAEPTAYVRGLLRLLPRERRRRAAETLFAAAHVLRYWLVGQAVAMAFVGLAMGIGFGLIGVQLAFILGVLAGLFEFIPLLGPLLALGPALLLALAESTQQAAYVLALYSVVQTIESYVLTPMVQRMAVRLPPVVTITAQVSLSWAAGPIGLLVAVPLAAVVMVVTQMLYVEDRLGDAVAENVDVEARTAIKRERTRMLRDLLPE